MTKWVLFLGILLLGAAGTEGQTMKAGEGGAAAVGEKIAGFTLEDQDGNEYSLQTEDGVRAVVLMFVSVQCPVSNAYNGRMQALYRDYSGKGVRFLGINANRAEPVDAIRKHAAENGFGFPVLKDTDNRIADQLGASVTPEIYLLLPDRTLVYHGRIDDSRREDDVTARDLRRALDEVLAGKTVSVERTKAFGCSIKRKQM